MIDISKMKALAAKLRGPINKFDNTAAAYSESAQAIEDLLSELEAATSERDEFRELHTAGCREAYSKMGIEDDGEYRWKWVLLGISNLVWEEKKLRAELEAREADRRDADRYRWLKNNSNVQFDYPVEYPIGFGKQTIWSSMPARLEMDRAIDAALAQRQEGGDDERA